MRLKVMLLVMGMMVSVAADAIADGPSNGPATKTQAKPVAKPLMFGDSEYRLGAEDVIEVFVWKEPELSSTVVVRPDGNVSLPLIGELEAAGRTATYLQAEIAKRLKQYVSEPVVNVMVKEINSPKISVLGQVRKPDVYAIKRRITVLEAIALAGGFTDFAKKDRVYVLRNGQPNGQQRRIKVDLKNAVKEGTGMLYLEPTDTVYVE
jgi:polysaccharide biosynthesis/export protein